MPSNQKRRKKQEKLNKEAEEREEETKKKLLTNSLRRCFPHTVFAHLHRLLRLCTISYHVLAYQEIQMTLLLLAATHGIRRRISRGISFSLALLQRNKRDIGMIVLENG
jgi:hypothetical protein